MKKNIYILGGCGGIGKELSLIMARSNFNILIGYYHNKLFAEKFSNEIANDSIKVQICFVDLADFLSVESFFEYGYKNIGLPDYVVNCAGLISPRIALKDLSIEHINDIINVNLKGVFYLLKEASKLMSLTNGGNGGSIVLLSSEAAKFGGNLISAYAATKGAINTITIGLARELALDGIRLNTVSPGVIENDKNSDDIDINAIPLRRKGTTIEVANSIKWLLSEESSYVNGAILQISGGR